MLGPQMVVSFQKVMGHLGGTVLLEEVCHWRAGLEVLQSAPLPVYSLPAWGCNVSSPPPMLALPISSLPQWAVAPQTASPSKVSFVNLSLCDHSHRKVTNVCRERTVLNHLSGLFRACSRGAWRLGLLSCLGNSKSPLGPLTRGPVLLPVKQRHQASQSAEDPGA